MSKLVLVFVLVCAGTDALADWAQARFVHAAPQASEPHRASIHLHLAGHFEVNGTRHDYRLYDIPYGAFTNSFGYPAADFDIVIRRSHDGQIILEKTISLTNGEHHWIILVGDGVHQPFDLLVIRSVPPAWDSGQVALNFVNAAPLAESLAETAISVRNPDGSPFAALPPVLEFGQESTNQLLDPGEQVFEVVLTGHEQARLQFEPVDLDGQPTLNQMILIGNGIHQPLEILSVPGGRLISHLAENSVVSIDNSVLGMWDTANTIASEGLMLQPLPDQKRLIGTLYTYADDDSGTQRWYFIDTCEPGQDDAGHCPPVAGFDGRQAMATVMSTAGSRLGSDMTTTVESVGVLAIEFVDCEQAIAVLSFEDGSEVSWDLHRLTKTVGCTLHP